MIDELMLMIDIIIHQDTGQCLPHTAFYFNYASDYNL